MHSYKQCYWWKERYTQEGCLLTFLNVRKDSFWGWCLIWNLKDSFGEERCPYWRTKKEEDVCIKTQWERAQGKPRMQRHKHPLSFFVFVGVCAQWCAGTSPLNSNTSTKALSSMSDCQKQCSCGEDDRKFLFCHVDDVTLSFSKI